MPTYACLHAHTYLQDFGFASKSLFAEAMDIVRQQQRSTLRREQSDKELPDTTFITASAEAVARAADVVMDQVQHCAVHPLANSLKVTLIITWLAVMHLVSGGSIDGTDGGAALGRAADGKQQAT